MLLRNSSYYPYLLLVALFMPGRFAVAAEPAQAAFDVVAEVKVGNNALGVQPGSKISLQFMLDPGLSPTLSLSDRARLIFIDPWRWHWTKWDWLRGFIIRIPRWPFPEPDPEPFLQLEAVFDDASDMIMEMPGIPPTERETAFLTNIAINPESPFLKEGRLPSLDELNKAFIPQRSVFMVLNPEGKEMLLGTIETLKASPSAPPCKGDVDGDGDVDATDVRGVRQSFGRNNCPLM